MWSRLKPALASQAVAVLALAAAAGLACAPDGTPTRPEPSVTASFAAYYSDDLRDYLKLSDGVSAWTWSVREDGGAVRRGTALLTLAGAAARWRLLGDDGHLLHPLPDSGRLHLAPLVPEAWHTVSADWPAAVLAPPLPLPRRAVRSPVYRDQLELLSDLLAPAARRRLMRWPGLPVPVRAPGTAVNGEVDLVLCLQVAVALWNGAGPDSLFRWNPAAARGIRLVHLPERTVPPAFSVRLVRLDDAGNPYRLHLFAGGHHTAAAQTAEAIGGLVRALGRALLLAGYSRDPRHVLADGPGGPAPTEDERSAARLLCRLPAGLDLSRYGRSAEMDAQR